MMKSILLIGLGRFGRTVAEKLHSLGHEVMAVDKNEDRVNAVMSFVTNAEIGDSTDDGFLDSLGVRNFDLCIVAIGDCFQDSLETTSLLKELGAVKVISRASSEVHEKFLRRNGADEVVFPEKQTAVWTAMRYSSDHIFDYVALNNDYGIYEVSVPLKWLGKTIRDLDVRQKFQINVLALKENGVLNMDVTSDTLLTENCNMMVVGKRKDIQKCFHI